MVGVRGWGDSTVLSSDCWLMGGGGCELKCAPEGDEQGGVCGVCIMEGVKGRSTPMSGPS